MKTKEVIEKNIKARYVNSERFVEMAESANSEKVNIPQLYHLSVVDESAARALEWVLEEGDGDLVL